MIYCKYQKPRIKLLHGITKISLLKSVILHQNPRETRKIKKELEGI